MLEEDKAQLYYIRNSLHNAAFNDVVQNCDSVFEVRKPACVDGTEGNHSGKIIGMVYNNEDKLISLKEDIEGRIRKSNLKIDEIIEESNSQQKEELKKAYYIRYKMKLVTNAAGNITVSTKPAFIKNTVTGTDLKYDLLSLVNILIKLGANSEAVDIKQFVKTINEVKYYVKSKEAGTATRIYFMNEFGEKKQVNVNNILLIKTAKRVLYDITFLRLHSVYIVLCLITFFRLHSMYITLYIIIFSFIQSNLKYIRSICLKERKLIWQIVTSSPA